jgi:LPXTG-site transpeptidase (sortase) family protein
MVGVWPARVFAAAEPRLGTAANFAILAASTITSTGNTVINGNLGLDPGTSVTGFGPGVITGTQHIHDATAAQAKSDLATAYGDAVAAASTSNLTGQDLGGMTLPSGVYTFNSSAQLTGILTLTGTGVFIFQIGSTLTTAPNAAVVVAAGAQPCAVYWQVGSSATIDTGTQFQGNVMAQASITMNSGANIVTGRAMAQTAAVTLIDNTITTPAVPCVPTPPAADIGITKTVDNATPNLGSNVTFTITATNHGPDNATGVQVTDLLPAGLTFVSATPSVGTYDSGTGIWTIGAIANGANATLAIIATVTGTATLTNTATKTAEDQGDPVSGNNTATATVTALGADIGITKTVDNSTPSLGSNVTFTVTATNHGPGNATGVQVTDLLPAGLTYVFSVASVGTYDSVTGIWNIGAVANTANATLAITATVTGTTTLTNTATKTAEDEIDPVSANNSATATLTARGADIGITKTVDNSTPNVGSSVIFTIIATNNGPANATGVQVTDVLPAGLSLVMAAPGVGTYSSGVWTIGGLANGANATLVITATVTGTAALTNTATKTAEDQADPVSGNNSASAIVNPVSADIGITKSVDNSTPSLGSSVIFTITATNHGPSSATGVQVTDLLPAGLSFSSAVPSVGTYNSVTGVWNVGVLANGANATLAITATVTGTAALTNTATKTAEDQVDPVSGNNSATATVSALGADIGITKTVDNSTPNLGSGVTFTITATNHGPGTATGVQVTDLLPAGLTYVSSVASVGTYDSGTGAWIIGALANGANGTLSITATVTGTAALTNTATKTAEDQVDPVSGNNSASASVTPVSADIGLTKIVDNATPSLGSNVTFTITATNHGPSSATGVKVTDVLPAGLTYVSSVATAGTTYDSGTGIWTIGALANGLSAALSITATVTTTASVTNTANKTGEDQVDPVAGNNSASAVLTGQAADIGVTKTVDNATPNLGSSVTFTITATNHGPSNATGVQVTDVLPAGLTYVSSVASAGTTYDSVTGIWNIGALANTANATLSITATVTTTAAVINTAAKTAEVQPDLVSSNDSASATVTGQAADIGVIKTVDNATPLLGSNVTFTITATNHGPSNATGVQVTDVLPAGLTFVSSVASVGTYDSGTGVWNIGALANSANATLSITATATRTTAVINMAAKTAELQPDLVPGNDSSSATVTGQAADIGVTKTVDNPTPLLGSNVTFTITATNHGPSNATGVQVTDVLPAGLTYASSVASVGTYDSGTGVWNIGALGNGLIATLSITATVTATTSVINTAAKTAEVQPDLVPGNDSASVTVTGQAADIAVTKTVDNSTPLLGSNVTFTIIATNHGPSNATGVQVTDVLPAGLTYVSSLPSAGTYDSGTGVWNIGALANTASATLAITATATSTAAVINTASKTAEVQPDLVPGNDSASATVTGQAADIGVTKTVDNSVPLLGSNVTFTIIATNHGPSNATGVQVTDLLPAGLTYVSSVASAGTYDPVTGIWNIGAMISGANATLAITATATRTTAVINTAAKTAELQPDLVPANDSSSATVTGQAADISVNKTVDNATPNLGSNVTFTITATNHGPSNATGVQVTDVLPAGLTYVSSLASAGTYDPVTGIWNIGAMTSGTNATLALTATATRTTSVINTATKTAEVQPNPVPGNDSSSATVTGQAADIAVTKTVDNATPNLGSNVTFIITATNNGPSNATGVQVTDMLPVGLTYVSSLASAGPYDPVTGIWNIGALTSGTNATLSIVATATRTTLVINTAAKTAEVQPDLVPGNDSASATVNGQAADIAVTKTVNNSTPNLGSNVTFTITATNHGPSNATGVQVTDVLPAGLTYVSSLASAGTYDPVTGIWNIGAMTSGTNATLALTATATRTTSVINTATKTAEVQPDPVPANDSSSATVTGQAADIAVTKTVDNQTPNLGTNVTFTITATNNGPSNATGVQVTDVLPAGLTYVSSLASAGTYDSVTGVWNIGALTNATNATLAIVATVTRTTPLINTAAKTAEVQPDSVPANNSATATVTPVAADIGLTKTVDNATPIVGTNVTFTITATNHGPSNATGVQVTDVLPAGLTFVSSVASAGSYDSATGVWTIGALATGPSANLSITATVIGTAPVTNTASKTAEMQPDQVPGNDSASVTVTGQPDPPGLPGLPNTSAPDVNSGQPMPNAPEKNTALALALLAVAVAGLGLLGLAGIGLGRSRARVGARRSRRGQRQSSRAVVIALLAAVLSLAVSSFSAGELASHTSTHVVALAPPTQLIGTNVVSVTPPAPPGRQSFYRVAGPITPSRLRIPSIGVDSSVAAVGLLADGSMGVPDNLWTSSWLANGPRPGEPGNAVIAGHRGVGSPALFSHLENVQPGDRIYVSDPAGNKLIYVVTGVAILDLGASTQVAVFKSTPTEQLVLVTCFGQYIARDRTYDHRLVVFSVPLALS